MRTVSPASAGSAKPNNSGLFSQILTAPCPVGASLVSRRPFFSKAPDSAKSVRNLYPIVSAAFLGAADIDVCNQSLVGDGNRNPNPAPRAGKVACARGRADLQDVRGLRALALPAYGRCAGVAWPVRRRAKRRRLASDKSLHFNAGIGNFHAHSNAGSHARRISLPQPAIEAAQRRLSDDAARPCPNRGFPLGNRHSRRLRALHCRLQACPLGHRHRCHPGKAPVAFAKVSAGRPQPDRQARFPG